MFGEQIESVAGTEDAQAYDRAVDLACDDLVLHFLVNVDALEGIQARNGLRVIRKPCNYARGPYGSCATSLTLPLDK
eukprot:1657386-Pleurochrysis_carterae.AAC.1